MDYSDIYMYYLYTNYNIYSLYRVRLLLTMAVFMCAERTKTETGQNMPGERAQPG